MRVRYDGQADAVSIQLVDEIGAGEVDRDVGPQLTPSGGMVTMAYDRDGFLLDVEVLGASRALRSETLGSRSVRAVRSSRGVDVVLVTDVPTDGELMLVGPQLTPNGGTITLAFDRSGQLVLLRIEGERVLRSAR